MSQPRNSFADNARQGIEQSAKAPSPPKPAELSSAYKSEAHPSLLSLRSLAHNAEFDAFRQAWPIAMKERGDEPFLVALYTLIAETELAAGNHDGLTEAANVLIERFGAPEGHYALAQSEFLHGEYDAAIRRLESVVYKHRDYVDATRLLAKSLRDSGQIEAAWRSLETLLPRFNDTSIWSTMATLVESHADFIRLLAHFHRQQDIHGSSSGAAVSEKGPLAYVALGALRVGNFTLAKMVWEDLLRHMATLPAAPPITEPTIVNYSSRRAQLALIDLKRTLQTTDVPMFLVSGTLLGCVREGQLLGHDHDVDVGIWDNVDREHLLDTVRTSGLFYDKASRAPEIVRLKHVNGIIIDVFYHFRSPGDYWHRGVKIIWHNSPFGLATREFLGEEFLIPDDYDTYLTENYGDWRTPKINFDCAFDTPNAEVANRDELIIHTCKMLGQAMAAGTRGRTEFFLEKLKDLGRANLVEDLTKILSM